MTASKPKDLSASVRQRLMNYSVASKSDFLTVLSQYGFERLLYRISKSNYARQFTVKGGLMFVVWAGEQYRPTRDLDLSAMKQHTASELEVIFKAICEVEIEDDGLIFDTGSIEAMPIREDTEYGGIRISMGARLGRARILIQVDIGYGDAITPRAMIGYFPALLDFPPPKVAMYPKETAIAEKYETIVRRGIINSRMKDYYDIWALSQSFDFEGEVLRDAIRATFHRRKTALPVGVPEGLSPGFSADQDKLIQWRAFVRRTRLKLPAYDLAEVVVGISSFLLPPSLAAMRPDAFSKKWQKGKGWE